MGVALLIAFHAGNQKLTCPRQLPNIHGKHYSIEDGNVVRLYEFLPGKIFCDVTPSENLFYHAGVYLGKLSETLKVSRINSISVAF